MKFKLSKVQKSFCIFFISLLFISVNSLLVHGSSYSPNTSVPVDGDRTAVNGTYVTSHYGLYLNSYSSVTNTAQYSVASFYSFEGRAELYSDNLYINNVFVGEFSSNNGWHNAGTIERSETFPATLHSGWNTMETRNVNGVGGEATRDIFIQNFATPPEVVGTNGVWNEGDVASGKRTWQSLYTDGATGSGEGNKVQTSTGFMYKDVDEQATPVNSYSSATIGRNSYLAEIKDAGTGVTLPLSINTLNAAGAYWLKSCTKDSGGLEGCGTRYITVKQNNPPVINGTNKAFYEGQYTHDQWINSLRWQDMSASDVEDGNITSKVNIIYDNVNVNTAGNYKVIYMVTDSGGKTTNKEISVTVKYNNPPVITGTDKTFYEGQYTSAYWLNTLRWKDMSASDVEDGNITSKVKITYDNVNVNVPNVYKVVYSVTDSFGKSTSKEIKVTVKYNNPPVIKGTDKTFYEGQHTSAYWLNTLRWKDMSASDVEDGNITSKVKITYDNVDVNVPNVYKVVYSVTDSFGKSTSKEIKVTVKYNNPPTITAEDRWFYVDEDVTNTRLMERVKANDIEDGNITAKAIIKSSNVQGGVLGDYKVTYKVTDAFGKSSEATANIHIVTNIPEGDDRIQYLRFISTDYLNTLKPNSTWRTGDKNTLLNSSVIKVEDSQAKEHWQLSKEDIERIKEFNNTHGISKESNQEFLEQFGYLRQ